VLHTTDEVVTEFAIAPYSAEAPLHVVALRTPRGKYALYSHFEPRGIARRSEGQEVELYDYRTRAGRMELENLAGRSHLEERLRGELHTAIANELHAPLPRHMRGARERGFADYHDTAGNAAAKASERRRRLLERRSEEGPDRASERLNVGVSPTERARRRAARRATRRRTAR
jgi:hypothetical protein